ncbi:MAG: acetylxylan esterase [Chitinophagaceae bacterium]
MKFKALTVLLLLVHTFCNAQKEYRIFDWKTEYTLNSYLLQHMHEQYDERRVVFENALKSKDSLSAYIAGIKAKFTTLLGDLPPTSSLNAQIIRTTTHTHKFKKQVLSEYQIERIVYESFPGHHVTANLYIPTSKGFCEFKSPYPAILFFCGHEDAGKATESYQQMAAMLATYGSVVMVVDPVSQSERHQLTDAAGKPLTRGGTTEHTLINASSNLVGTSSAAYELWDNKRALDYLYTRPEVDTSRIGCAGNSGGAMQAIYFAAHEPRIKVIAVASYLASRERTFDLTGAPDGCALIPGEGKALLEMSDYLVAAAPRPLLVLAGRYDFIDYNGTLASFKDLQRVYALLGHPEKLRLQTYEDGHGIGADKRVGIGHWFKDWFRPEGKCYVNDVTDRINVLPDTSLFSTQAGQVNKSFKNEVTVFDRNLALADSLNESRKKFMQQPREAAIKGIMNLLQIDLEIKGSNTGYAGDVTKNGISFRKVPVSVYGAVPMSVLQAYPENVSPKKVIIWLHSAGKQVIADSTALLRSYFAEGTAVYIADIRGIGETQDAPALNDPKYYNKEYRTAMLALHNGSSLVAQRAVDIANLVENVMYGPGWPPATIEIHAEGHLGVAALHAMAVMKDFRVSCVKLYNCITSFKDILKDPTRKDWYSYVIPNVLKYYDIPDLVNLIGKEKVQFINLQK